MRPPLDISVHAVSTGIRSVVASILLPSLVIDAYAIVQRDVLAASTSVEVAS